MKKRRIFALMLASSMLLSACGQKPADEGSKEVSQNNDKVEKESESQKVEEKEESKYPEYLNLDSTYPIIKDEYADEMAKKVTAKFMADASCTKEWDELFTSAFLKEKYNLDLDVDMVDPQALGEQKSLALNSGDMPDMLWNFWLSTNEIYKYGVVEGVLLPLDEYISEELCPNIYKLIMKNDYIRESITAPDGHIYSLPFLDEEDNPTSIAPRYYINEKYLEMVGKELPATVDEFVDVMYTLKEQDPSGLGSENFYPIGGTISGSGVGALLNGFGYVSARQYAGELPAVRDGKAVIPAYDMDVFQEYLKIMNQFYNDGILDPACFTMDQNAANAELLKGALAIWEGPVSVIGVQDWDNWGALTPLTSDWQEEPEVAKPNNATVGCFVVSADTEYPELILRFADQYYNNETGCASDFWGGPAGDSEFAVEGFVYNIYDKETGVRGLTEDEYTDGADIWRYYVGYMHGNMPYWGAYAIYDAAVAYQKSLGITEISGQFDYDLTDSTQHYAHSIYTRVRPYVTPAFPTLYFVDESVSQKMTDLETVIKPYILEQVALFITGGRSLSETGDFVAELEGMGIKELLDIYQSILDNGQ